jgi:electron transfer flavoprotein beta subunit
MSLGDLGIAGDEVGAAGASTTVVAHSKRPPRQAGTRVTDDGNGGAALVEYLAAEKFI